MDYYHVIGGSQLNGKIDLQGSKNAVLPVLSATILNCETTLIAHCPKISDVSHTIQILESIGAKVWWEDDCLAVDASKVSGNQIPFSLTHKMRSSIGFLGAMIGRLHHAVICQPGGCNIGKRPIDLHIESLEKMGVMFEYKNEKIICSCKELHGSNISLKIPSVGATENIMMAAARAKGPTRIENAAREPEVITLASYLTSIGCKITGAGTEVVTVYPSQQNCRVTIMIPADRIVAGTYLAMAAGCGGEVELNGVSYRQLEEVISVLRTMGCRLITTGNSIIIKRPLSTPLKSAQKIVTSPYPGFPTDLQSVFMVLSTAVDHSTEIVENIFSNRYQIVKEILKMGGIIQVGDNRRLCVFPSRLHASTVTSRELRGAAALIFAGMIAEGETVIEDEEYLKRGYERLPADLNSIGGHIMECRRR